MALPARYSDVPKLTRHEAHLHGETGTSCRRFRHTVTAKSTPSRLGTRALGGDYRGELSFQSIAYKLQAVEEARITKAA
jgi:hypothetical protein